MLIPSTQQRGIYYYQFMRGKPIVVPELTVFSRRLYVSAYPASTQEREPGPPLCDQYHSNEEKGKEDGRNRFADLGKHWVI